MINQQAVILALYYLISVVKVLIWCDVIMSFIPPLRGSRLYFTIQRLTDPVLSPIRSLINKTSLGSGLMIDFSPLFALIILDMLQNLLRKL